jgi:p-hydroxybenzoate 3-monooxygenase
VTVRPSAFGSGFEAASVSHPFRELTLIAAVPLSSQATIYGLHRNGFAGQMHRSPAMTRFMLEVPAGDTLDDWPDAPDLGAAAGTSHRRRTAADSAGRVGRARHP